MRQSYRFALPLALAAGFALVGCGGPAAEEPAPETTAAAPEPAPAAGDFMPIFDGKSLEGWKLLGGHGEGYLVENGEIVLPKGGGGNLFYDEELKDFVFRFEFKLEDGSNNGLCIRCPMTDKDTAYQGNELQIIDNNSDRYKDIKVWQKHGSLYNVFPADPNAPLKPAGEWNQEEVTVQGRTVKVVLNGATILDVNMDDVTDPETIEHHPGLKRETGYIGFLGHNEPIEFRNLELKKL
ncbi:MAG: DUF1080 domain-containing protein [Bryobacterales bacterium]